MPYGCSPSSASARTLVTQARGLNLLYQYWIHTDTIRSLGPAERVLNTPSHHRVHHGCNRQYLDRNHGSILIVWDRLFGTFEPEDGASSTGSPRTSTRSTRSRWPPTSTATCARRRRLDHLARPASFVLRGPGWAYERHRQLAAAGDAIVDEPSSAVTAA